MTSTNAASLSIQFQELPKHLLITILNSSGLRWFDWPKSTFLKSEGYSGQIDNATQRQAPNRWQTPNYGLTKNPIYGILGIRMRLVRFPEFLEWLNRQTTKNQAQIEARLKKIEDFDHLGDSRNLGEGLAELKWSNGRRVYFSLSRDAKGRIVILILGGNKNGQEKDIRAARKILASHQK